VSKTDAYTVSVGKIATKMVVTQAPPSSIAAGVSFTFAGYIQDQAGNRLANKRVRVMIDGAESMSMNTGSDGTWGFGITLTSPGSHTIYAEFQGDTTYEGC
jgi:hypothetical protein